MNLTSSHLKRALGSLVLAGLSATATSTGQVVAADAASSAAVLHEAKHAAHYQETFERGTQRWTPNRRTAVRVHGVGRDSRHAARLSRTRGPGVAVARTRVAAGAPGSRLVAKAHLRSTRGKAPASLVVREVEPSTGAVLAKRRDRLAAGSRWKRARAGIVITSSSSVVTLEVRTALSRRQALLLDDVLVRRGDSRVSTPSAPAPAPAPSTGWPGPDNTGVPAGVTLNQRGALTVTQDGAVIQNQHIRGELLIQAANVTVRNTRVTGWVRLYDADASLEMVDSEIIDPDYVVRGLTNHHITLKRVEIRGFVQSMECNQHCYVYDSWLHGQHFPPGEDWHHGDGILIDGGSNFVFRHNTLACDAPATGGGGCSAALALYNGPSDGRGGYQRTMRNTVVDNNLFKASVAGFCAYLGGAQSDNVDVTNNVWERGSSGKCGVYGPLVNPPKDANSEWSNNRYTDGTLINR